MDDTKRYKGTMKELFYFSFSKVLIRVEYQKEINTMRYSSHRELTFGERVVVEQYIFSNFAVKTDFFNQNPATFTYLGVDKELEKELNLFQLKNTIKSMAGKDQAIKEEIDSLMAKSMTNYYFEQIGDEILSLRRNLDNDDQRKIITESREKINELIKAFNAYSDKKVTLAEVIPGDLKNHFDAVDVDMDMLN
ncbi:hypothetical protein JW960_08535 [candidate division KSB1 bacterium]|nr:hypothetical protein [candidate division KSB1 bacterium]